MQLLNDSRRYGAVAQTLHWAIAALMVSSFVIAVYMTDLPLDPYKVKVYNLHKSIGVTILLLAVLRLGWRLVSPPPPLPPGMPSWERAAARASHVLLYVLLFLQPVIGIAHSWAADFPVVVFGMVPVPAMFGPDEALKETLQSVHGALGWTLIALVMLHVTAALRHHFLLKDDILRRMLPGGIPAASTAGREPPTRRGAA